MSKQEDIAETIINIIAEQLEVKHEDIKPESSFVGDFGADSLALVELVLAVEEKFEIKIADDEVPNLRTVGDTIELVRARRK